MKLFGKIEQMGPAEFDDDILQLIQSFYLSLWEKAFPEEVTRDLIDSVSELIFVYKGRNVKDAKDELLDVLVAVKEVFNQSF